MWRVKSAAKKVWSYLFLRSSCQCLSWLDFDSRQLVSHLETQPMSILSICRGREKEWEFLGFLRVGWGDHTTRLLANYTGGCLWGVFQVASGVLFWGRLEALWLYRRLWICHWNDVSPHRRGYSIQTIQALCIMLERIVHKHITWCLEMWNMFSSKEKTLLHCSERVFPTVFPQVLSKTVFKLWRMATQPLGCIWWSQRMPTDSCRFGATRGMTLVAGLSYRDARMALSTSSGTGKLTR